MKLKEKEWYKSKEEREWVQREIDKLIFAGPLVDDVMTAQAEYPHANTDEWTHDNIENLAPIWYECEECGHIDHEEEPDECPKCKNWDFKETDGDFQEIMQWFIVDRWTAKRLAQIGEPVLHASNLSFWGRTCYGQDIELDGTFQTLYRRFVK